MGLPGVGCQSCGSSVVPGEDLRHSHAVEKRGGSWGAGLCGRRRRAAPRAPSGTRRAADCTGGAGVWGWPGSRGALSRGAFRSGYGVGRPALRARGGDRAASKLREGARHGQRVWEPRFRGRRFRPAPREQRTRKHSSAETPRNDVAAPAPAASGERERAGSTSPRKGQSEPSRVLVHVRVPTSPRPRAPRPHQLSATVRLLQAPPGPCPGCRSDPSGPAGVAPGVAALFQAAIVKSRADGPLAPPCVTPGCVCETFMTLSPKRDGAAHSSAPFNARERCQRNGNPPTNQSRRRGADASG